MINSNYIQLFLSCLPQVSTGRKYTQTHPLLEDELPAEVWLYWPWACHINSRGAELYIQC